MTQEEKMALAKVLELYSEMRMALDHYKGLLRNEGLIVKIKIEAEWVKAPIVAEGHEEQAVS